MLIYVCCVLHVFFNVKTLFLLEVQTLDKSIRTLLIFPIYEKTLTVLRWKVFSNSTLFGLIWVFINTWRNDFTKLTLLQIKLFLDLGTKIRYSCFYMKVFPLVSMLNSRLFLISEPTFSFKFPMRLRDLIDQLYCVLYGNEDFRAQLNK
jgi:hypothetical protein